MWREIEMKLHPICPKCDREITTSKTDKVQCTNRKCNKTIHLPEYIDKRSKEYRDENK